jgi:hypothetical protein
MGKKLSPIQRRLASQLKAKGISKKGRYAISTSVLQKAGDLKKGTNKATKKGVKRGKMTPDQRAKTRKS